MKDSIIASITALAHDQHEAAFVIERLDRIAPELHPFVAVHRDQYGDLQLRVRRGAPRVDWQPADPDTRPAEDHVDDGMYVRTAAPAADFAARVTGLYNEAFPTEGALGAIQRGWIASDIAALTPDQLVIAERFFEMGRSIERARAARLTTAVVQGRKTGETARAKGRKRQTEKKDARADEMVAMARANPPGVAGMGATYYERIATKLKEAHGGRWSPQNVGRVLSKRREEIL